MHQVRHGPEGTIARTQVQPQNLRRGVGLQPVPQRSDLDHGQLGAVAALAVIEQAGDAFVAIGPAPRQQTRARAAANRYDFVDTVSGAIETNRLEPQPGLPVTTVVIGTLKLGTFAFIECESSVVHADLLYEFYFGCP